MKNGFVSML